MSEMPSKSVPKGPTLVHLAPQALPDPEAQGQTPVHLAPPKQALPDPEAQGQTTAQSAPPAQSAASAQSAPPSQSAPPALPLSSPPALPQPAGSPVAMAFLANRRSHPAKFFAGPTPDRAALQAILTTALRVPDHGKLEPWRLIVLGRGDMVALADLAEARAQALGLDAEKIAKGRGQFDLGVCAVVVISTPVDQQKVPPAEQILSAGALCMNLLHAATAAGWGANWLTGWPAHDPGFAAAAFGCGSRDSVAGIVHIGTPGPAAADRPRPDLARLVQWGLDAAAVPHSHP